MRLFKLHTAQCIPDAPSIPALPVDSSVDHQLDHDLNQPNLQMEWSRQLAEQHATMAELQQQTASLQQQAEKAREEIEQHKRHVADLNLSNDRKRKELTESSNVTSRAIAHKKHKQQQEIWLKDTQPLEDSLQGALGEVGIGVQYLPSFCPPEGLEPLLQTPSILRLYKQTFVHGGNLYMIQAELQALQRMQSLASPYFPKLAGEANILMPVKENGHRQARIVRGIAMEFIPGITLSRLLKPGNGYPSFLCLQSLQARVKLCSQLLRGMQQMHEARVIHRDIKPTNIVITSPDIYRHMVHAEMLPQPILRMRSQRWVDFSTVKNLKSTSAGYKLFASVVSHKEANSVLFVDRFCTGGSAESDHLLPPQPLDVAGARLVILDLNTCDVLPFQSQHIPKYTNSYGTPLFQWRNWFCETQCYDVNKCKSATEGFDFDAFAVGIVIMDLIRTISVERVPMLETARSFNGQYPFIKQSVVPFCNSIFVQSPALSSSESIVVPSLALFFRDGHLCPSLWSAGFVSANTLHLQAFFKSHPSLFDLLHKMTRIRFIPSREEELRISPIPTMASVSVAFSSVLSKLSSSL